MKKINQINQTRDYNKNPIIIKDYGSLFDFGLLMLIFSIVIILWIIDLSNMQVSTLEEINFYSFEFLRKIFVMISIIWFVHHSLKTYPKKFKNKPSYFQLTNDSISYHGFLYDEDYKEFNYTVDINYIKEIYYCIVSELPERYGRLHYLTSWQLYSKSSIGVHIGKSVLFLRYLLIYILFVLSYKIYRLINAKEPLRLLSKNIFVQFDNRNYFLINVYTQQELEKLMEYFQSKNIAITQKTKFIPHLQNQGWFVDKEEVWTNNFNKGATCKFQKTTHNLS